MVMNNIIYVLYKRQRIQSCTVTTVHDNVIATEFIITFVLQ